MVSARKEDGNILEVKITSEAGGVMHLKLPFKTFYISGAKKKYTVNENLLKVVMRRGETIVVKNGFT